MNSEWNEIRHGCVTVAIELTNCTALTLMLLPRAALAASMLATAAVIALVKDATAACSTVALLVGGTVQPKFSPIPTGRERLLAASALAQTATAALATVALSMSAEMLPVIRA